MRFFLMIIGTIGLAILLELLLISNKLDSDN